VHHQIASTLRLDVVVRGVVRDVAVDHPFARLERRPDDIVALPRTDVDGVGLLAGRGRQRLAVARDDPERAPVDVHRVNEG
jgi:hypothetical protein